MNKGMIKPHNGGVNLVHFEGYEQKQHFEEKFHLLFGNNEIF